MATLHIRTTKNPGSKRVWELALNPPNRNKNLLESNTLKSRFLGPAAAFHNFIDLVCLLQTVCAKTSQLCSRMWRRTRCFHSFKARDVRAKVSNPPKSIFKSKRLPESRSSEVRSRDPRLISWKLAVGGTCRARRVVQAETPWTRYAWRFPG